MISAIGPIINVVFFVNKMGANISSFSTRQITKQADGQGTGSYPPLEKGLHLKILHAAMAPPFTGPYFSTASSPYWEQEGI